MKMRIYIYYLFSALYGRSLALSGKFILESQEILKRNNKAYITQVEHLTDKRGKIRKYVKFAKKFVDYY